MSSLFVRITKRLRMTGKSFVSDCYFSPWYGLLRIGDELGGRLGLVRLSQWAHREKDRWMLDYLKRLLDPVFATFQEDRDIGQEGGSTIWTCWWSGEETAPVLVRRCLESIRSQAGNHSVCLITKENYRQYLEIPDFILEKTENGQIGLAHLADYIRVKLLSQYGGLWLDATIYCAEQIPEEYFMLPLFSFKGPKKNDKYISDYRWATFGLGGWRRSVFFRYMTAAFDQYWSKCDRAIDYLFFDYIIHLGVEQCDEIRVLIDEIPVNNLRRDDLQAAMNASLPASQFEQMVQPDTVMYKLSWRENYLEETENGQPTVYKKFLNLGRV